MIERYYHEAEGYNPFLIREGWQVAQLNYLPGHGLDDMVDVEVHRQTDEAFILLRERPCWWPPRSAMRASRSNACA